MKTKIGITAGLLGGIIYLCGLFGGYIPLIMLICYIVLVEKNDWLNYVALKALCVNIAFSAIIVIVGIIPDILGIIQNFIRLFNGSFTYVFITNIESLFVSILNLLKIITMLILAFRALTLRDLEIPCVDKLINIHLKQ